MSSLIVGRRQPDLPPVPAMMQRCEAVCGLVRDRTVRSHTNPVSRSSTASLFQLARITKRLMVSFWLQDGVA
jgi:hypothetical protein